MVDFSRRCRRRATSSDDRLFIFSKPAIVNYDRLVRFTDRHGIRFRAFKSTVIEARSEPVLNRPGYTLENGSGCLTIGVHLSGPLCQRGQTYEIN